MGQILIRNIDDDVHRKLKAKAAAAGMSLESYIRNMLRGTALQSKDEALAKADQVRALTNLSVRLPDPSGLINELRQERDDHLSEILNRPADDQ